MNCRLKSSRARQWASAVLLVAAMNCVPPVHAQIAANQKVALVIGNGKYKSVQQLANPTHDADLIATTLKNLGFSLIGNGAQENLTLSQFNSDLQLFSTAARTADVALFYYAGHGLQSAGTNYLVPTDSNPHSAADVQAQMVDATNVLGILDKTNVKLKIMILDACRNNPFANRGLLANSFGLADMSRGLTAMSAPTGTVIWYATQPGNVAQDGAGQNGPFATAISHNIIVPGLDIYGVFNQTGKEVAMVTNSMQIPWLAASYLDGDFYFVQSGAQTPRSVFVPPPAITSAADRIRSIFSSGVKASTRDFKWGQTYQEVNAELDTPFAIQSWASLPRASEYTNEEVHYFWVNLPSLPVVLSALVDPNAVSGHCIDGESYIAFFFKKDEKLFHISIRLFKGQTCSSYAWFVNGLFTDQHTAALIHTAGGDTSVNAHDTAQYSIIDVTEVDPEEIWTN